jgi:hypothetical protein
MQNSFHNPYLNIWDNLTNLIMTWLDTRATVTSVNVLNLANFSISTSKQTLAMFSVFVEKLKQDENVNGITYI